MNRGKETLAILPRQSKPLPTTPHKISAPRSRPMQTLGLRARNTFIQAAGPVLHTSELNMLPIALSATSLIAASLLWFPPPGLTEKPATTPPNITTKAVATTAPAAPSEDLRTLLTWMTGSFSSQEQSAADPENYFDIRLHMVPIWTDRTDGLWLYVEQAAAANLGKPYRQRVYRLAQTGANEFLSEVFTLPGDALQFAGAYADTAKLKDVSPETLTKRDGCAILLHRSQDGSYNGGTQGPGCASDLRGASYATSQAHITADGLRTWDRGYDNTGKQAWGAEKGPYIFKRVEDAAH
jgi:CpeT protein